LYPPRAQKNNSLLRAMRISGTSPQLFNLAKNIAANKGVSINRLLTPIVREIEKDLRELKLEANTGETRRIVLRGELKEAEDGIQKACEKLGIRYPSDLLKLKLAEKLAAFPDQLKKAPLNF